MRDLGSFPFGYPWGYSSASDINNSDQVIGSDGGQAFLYDDSTNGTKYLGALPGHNTSSASDINDSGQVVGSSATLGDDGYSYQNQRAFLYDDSTNGMKDLGTLPGHNASWASLINDSGQVVGGSATLGTDGNYQNQRAFLYDSTDGMKDLGTLPGYTDSRATAMNNSGQVVGYSYSPNEQNYHAFLYDSTNGMKDLGTLGGNRSYAYDINDSGQVVGYSYTASGESHAFLYEDGEMKDLGTLGGTSSYASDINDSGQVVGGSNDSSGQSHAFLYQNEERIDLGNRWFSDGDCIGWNLYSGNTKINNEGQIMVEATRQDWYKYGALILTPTSVVPPTTDCQDPSAPTITSPANNSYNKDGVVTLSGTAEAGSTVTVVDDASSPTTKTATADSNTGAWSVTFGSSSSKLADATYTYSAMAKDAAGNTSSASTLKVTVDKTAPTGTVSINNGDTRTRSQSVTLTLSATDPSPGSGVSQMRISNTQSGLTSASWEAYSTTKTGWKLSSGTGTKMVYVQYQDGAGNSSAIVSDTITYKP